MPDNPIYQFLKENNLTDKDEATFTKEYADPDKAQQLYTFFKANDLTDKDSAVFYNTYFKPTDNAGFDSKEVQPSSVTPQVTVQPDDMDAAHQQATLQTIRQAQQGLKAPVQPTTAFMTSPNTAATLSLQEDNTAARRATFQSEMDNGLQTLADQWGKPKAEVQEVVSKFGNISDAGQLQQLAQLKSDNPVLYNRTAASNQWQTILYNNILQNHPEQYNDIVQQVHQSQDWGAGTDFQQARDNTRYVARLINDNVTDEQQRNEALQALAESNANAYGGTMQGTDMALAGDRDMTFLNKAEKLALAFYDDTNPALAQGFRNNIGVNPATINQKMADGKPDLAAIGYSEQKAKLAATGADLMMRVANQHIAEYSRLINSGQQLTPEQQQDLADYQKQYNDALELQDRIHNPNDKEYGYAAQFELNNIAQELIGQKAGFLQIQGNEFRNSVNAPFLSAIQLGDAMFDSKENNKRLQLAVIGASAQDESHNYVTQANQPMRQFAVRLPDDLQDKITDIRNDRQFTAEQKRQQVAGLLAVDHRWYKQPTDPKFNLKAMFTYGVGDAVNALGSFMLNQAAMGGVGNISKVQKALATFSNVLFSDISKNYSQYLRNNEAFPLQKAMQHAAINGLVFAGGDVTGAIDKVLGNTAATDVVKGLSPEQRVALAAKVPSFYKNYGKALLESQQGALHMTGLGVGAAFANDMADGQVQSPADYGRQGLLMYLTNLPVTALGFAGKLSELNNIDRHGWYGIADKPEEHLPVVEDMQHKGIISPEQANLIRDNIQKAADVHANTNYTYDNGKVMSDDDKAKLLLTRIQEANLKEASKENNSDKAKEKIAKQLELTRHYANLIHEDADITHLGKLKDALQQKLDEKDEEGKSVLSDKDRMITTAQRDALDQFIKDKQKEHEQATATTNAEPVPQGNERVEAEEKGGTDTGVNQESKGTEQKQVTSPIQNKDNETVLSERLSPAEKQGSIAGGKLNVESTNIVEAIHRAGEENKPANGSLNEEKIRQQEEDALAGHAKESGNWLSKEAFDKKFSKRQINFGTEQNVYYLDGKHIVKSNHAPFHTTWKDFFERLALHNTLFPETKYELIGFADTEDGFSALVKQPYIKAERIATPAEIQSDMEQRGFKAEGENAYLNPDTGVRVKDLHPKNVLVDKEGNLFYVDPMVELDTADKSYGTTRKPQQPTEKEQVSNERITNSARPEDSSPASGTETTLPTDAGIQKGGQESTQPVESAVQQDTGTTGQRDAVTTLPVLDDKGIADLHLSLGDEAATKAIDEAIQQVQHESTSTAEHTENKQPATGAAAAGKTNLSAESTGSSGTQGEKAKEENSTPPAKETTGSEPSGKTKLSKSLRSKAAQIREKGIIPNESLPDFLKVSIELPEGTQGQGISSKGVSEAFAKSLELLADAIDAGKDAVDAAKEALEHMKGYYKDNGASFDEAKAKEYFEQTAKSQIGEPDNEHTKIANAVNDAFIAGKFGTAALDNIIAKLQDTDTENIYQKAKTKIADGTLKPSEVRERVMTTKQGSELDQAALLYDMAELKGKERGLMEAINKETDATNKAKLQQQLLDVQNEMLDNTLANRLIGRSASNIFRIRQEWVDKDLNLDTMMRQYRASKGGKELTAEQEQEVKDAYAKIRELDNQRKQLKEDYDKAVEANQQLKEVNDKIAAKLKEYEAQTKRQKQAERAQKNDEKIQQSNERIQKAKDVLRRLRGSMNDVTRVAPEAAVAISKIAAEKFYQGAVKLSELVAKVLDEVKDVFPEWTEKDVIQHLFPETDAEQIYNNKKAFDLTKEEIAAKKDAYLKAEKEFALKMYEWEKDRRTDMMEQKSLKERIIDGILRWQRFAVLSYPTTMIKLAAVVGHQLTFKPLKFGLQYLVSKATGNALKGAGVWGKPELRSLSKYYSALIQNFSLANLKEQFQGIDTKEVLYGRGLVYDEWAASKSLLDLPGRSHGYIKSFVKNPEFQFAHQQLLQQAMNKMSEIGSKLKDASLSESEREALQKEYDQWDISNLDNLQRINELSLAHGKWAILMNDNKFVDKFRQFADEKTALGAVLRSEMPVVKIPVNFVGRAFAYKYGLIKALTGAKWMVDKENRDNGNYTPSIFKVLLKGSNSITPEQSELLAKTLTLGSMGASFFVLGFAGSNNIKENEDGSFELFGVHISRNLIHSPELESIISGASTANQMREDKKKSFAEAMVHSDVDILKKNPFLTMLQYGFIPNVAQAMVDKRGTDESKFAIIKKAVGDKVAGMVVPGFIKQPAQWLDTKESAGLHPMGTPQDRKIPKDAGALEYIWQSIELGVPVLRENVPMKDSFNREDYQDKTFKYFIDKGLELPNVSVASVQVTDNKAGTELHVSDYPKAKQEEYQTVHKAELKKILAGRLQYGVWVRTSKDKDGEEKHSVLLTPPEDMRHTKKIQAKDLDQDELKQLLSQAQSMATTRAKHKIFRVN